VSTTAPEPLADRLGYLLKHVHLGFLTASTAALADHGIDGRELAVLSMVAAEPSHSQRNVAVELGINRTTMVALIDALEAKGLVERRTHPEDRRSNLVELTDLGRTTLRAGNRAAETVERRFLAPLSATEAAQFRKALRKLL
jgi:DNA-binding MarR family transcriptional regulator